ncbi:SWIM zinc finger family protein [Bacillus massiliigorillae]|uniref:SWIM zinc finger family protein n=1 Tax=Bacillus massiliigorillae TaxID=1243664 RepID=UPI0003A260DF|nr:hypothetical protein [Bacillus massiliigorillae]
MSDELLFFGKELQEIVNPKVPEDVVAAQRGLLLYRQNMVYQIQEEQGTITASVQDVVPCQVKLDLTEPTNSSCSCKQAAFCRHQLATFFTSYSSIASVSDWIQAWKSEKNSPTITRNSLQLQKAKELFQENKPLERNYASWKAFMEDTYTIQIGYNLYQPAYTLSSKWDVYFQRLKGKMPIEPPWKMLYLFVSYFQTYLFILRSIKKNEIKAYAQNFLEDEAQELVENMMYVMEQLTRISRPFAFDQFYGEIRNDLNELLNERGKLAQSSLDIYRAIWTHLLKEKTWRKEELQSLNEQLESNSNESLLAASIHLSFLTGDTANVTKLLSQLHPKDYPLLTYWIRYVDEQKSEPFLKFVMQNINAYITHAASHYKRKEIIQFLLPPIRKYCVNNKRMDTFEKFCEVCLPYSFVYYSNYLLDCGKHRKWVELCIYSNVELEYISKDEIKMIQDSDPSLLLPLYTSIVNEKIESKNRQSYRAAVRYLKKIRTIYKKQKKLEQWERYINQVQSSNTRLRAFQEELKRGKLIHVE